MEMFNRITFDPKIMGGRACLRGIRIPVSVIVGQIAHDRQKKVEIRAEIHKTITSLMGMSPVFL
jgi:uncharacterized protein (DUF433 family)